MTIHPAHQMSYQELRSGLLEASGNGHVISRTKGSLELWNYTDRCTYDKGWNKYTLVARGLILDVAAQRIVATPFPKFFNYGEGGYAVPNESFEVTEKLDGSLGIIYHYYGGWRVATRGSLESRQAQWAENWLLACANPWHLIPGTTYLAEIIYPENKIVIRYPESGLVMLSAFTVDGYEVPRPVLETQAAATNFKIAPLHHYNKIEDLLAVSKLLSSDKEGFVVRFESGHRIKIKGDEYCRIHRLISRCTPLAVYDAMVAGDDLEAIRKELPEEFAKDFDTIAEILGEAARTRIAKLKAAVEMTALMSDKDLGMLLQSSKHELGDIAPFIFTVRKKGMTWLQEPKGKAKFYNLFRPAHNVLEGYTASSAVSRFSQEAGTV